jgi:hypothetical protein
LWLTHNTLKERSGKDIDVQQGDSEIRLSSADRELTQVPVLFWGERGANFVVFKTGERRYRSQFFYRLHQQYSTGVDEFDDLSECLVTTLQVQADHATEPSGAGSTMLRGRAGEAGQRADGSDTRITS